MQFDDIVKMMQEEFGEGIITHAESEKFDNIVDVKPEKIKRVCLYLRDTEELSFDVLMVLSGVDDANGEKVKDDNDAEIIQGGTLSVYYHLDSIKHRHKVTLRVSVPRENPELDTVEGVWKTADWHEREAYDMFGIIFKGHPNMIRILMPYDWDAGHPLRKDYQNPEFYQGMKVPY